MLTHFGSLALLLCAGHALCDFPLQGTFLSMAKNRKVPGFPWQQALFAHCVIQGGMVLLLTRSLVLGVVELVLHYLIDLVKLNKHTGVDTDQALHYVMKLTFAFLVAHALVPRY